MCVAQTQRVHNRSNSSDERICATRSWYLISRNHGDAEGSLPLWTVVGTNGKMCRCLYAIPPKAAPRRRTAVGTSEDKICTQNGGRCIDRACLEVRGERSGVQGEHCVTGHTSH